MLGGTLCATCCRSITLTSVSALIDAISQPSSRVSPSVFVLALDVL